jgi:chromate transporter
VRPGSAREVLGAFLKLGFTSFGGPIAHLGYFRDEFVARRRWIDETGYADLVALCQFLPGPASSQVGFAIGLMRAGPLGALAAWTGFTMPSALLMLAFAYGSAVLSGPIGTTLVHGLKLVAVAIVAQAVLGMARSLTPDRPRAALAVGAVALVVLVGGALGQLGAIAVGALLGMVLCRSVAAKPAGPATLRVPRGLALACLVLFFALLFGAPLLWRVSGSSAVALFDAFYRSGALVFGGGHVVLPLLQAALVPRGWIGDDAFLAGYGAVQAMPGPLFTFAAYLGAAAGPDPHGVAGAAIALGAIFLPGLLILVAALPFWDRLRSGPAAQGALRGANAAVVGILAAALYDPVWTSAVEGPKDFLVALVGFTALIAWRLPPWMVVIGVVAVSAGLSLV